MSLPFPAVAVMEGVLAGTVTLGVCKSTCNLLSLPSVGASLNSVCFCCGCLLIFTDLTVTGEHQASLSITSERIYFCLQNG